MNPRALQRVVVRMLYDPALLEAVYSGAPVADLDAEGRAHLTRVDRRAWGTDPYRRTRTLQALIEELPVSAAVAGIDTLDAFFSSPDFHRAVQQRRTLVLAFAQWLEPRVGDIARLEGAIARARQQSPGTGAGLCMALGVAAVSVPEGLLQWWQEACGQLGPSPVCALLEGPADLETPPEGACTEHYLLERGSEGGIQLGGGSAALVGLLCAADTPISREALGDRAVAMGAEPDDVSELIEGLVLDGLLIQSGGI
jgi:hypothetical protein